LANDFEQQLHAISSELTAIEGPLEVIIIFLVSRTRLNFFDIVFLEGATTTSPAHTNSTAGSV
jgi:hypothetical protein